jgi:hypothetical protein
MRTATLTLLAPRRALTAAAVSQELTGVQWGATPLRLTAAGYFENNRRFAYGKRLSRRTRGLPMRLRFGIARELRAEGECS